MERNSAGYYREIALPAPVQKEGSKASFKNGITISTFHSFCNSYFSEQGKEYELVSNNFIRF